MKVLQLCCFTNQWSPAHEVESWDLRLKKNIFDIPLDYPKGFDMVAAAPPCDQFTKANAQNWQSDPGTFIAVARRCFELCLNTGGLWFLENPPGRIETFIPELRRFRNLTWRSPGSNKEYILYSNFLILHHPMKRYGRPGQKVLDNMTKKQREAWDVHLIPSIESNIESFILPL